MLKFQKRAKALRCKLAQLYNSPPQGDFKIKQIQMIAFIIMNRTNLDFIPGLTSTVLSELATTLTKTSPASGWFWRRRNLFTLSSRWFPKRVVCSPATRGNTPSKCQPWSCSGQAAAELQGSCSFLLWMEMVFFSLLFHLHVKIGWFDLYSPNEEMQTQK